MFELQRRPLSYVWNFEKDFEKLLNDPAKKEWRAHSEIIENENEYKVSVDVPGVKKEDVKIDLKDNVLVIIAKRESEESKENQKLVYQERFYGEYQRSFTLPDAVDLDNIKAQMDNGVLNIIIPKIEKKQTRQIQIN